MEEKKEKTRENILFEASSKDFMCPECGKKYPEVYDAGNGICDKCSKEYDC